MYGAMIFGAFGLSFYKQVRMMSQFVKMTSNQG